MNAWNRCNLLLLPALLAACAGAPLPPRPPPPVELVPVHWQAPLPPAAAPSVAPLDIRAGEARAGQDAHDGSLQRLRQWWGRWGDVQLLAVMDAAQGASPSVAAARTRLALAQAERVNAQAALQPGVDAAASASRGLTQWGMPLMSSAQGALRASWELDLFGLQRSALDAAQARETGARAQWHDARVSVAAEVALNWVAWQACQQQVTVAQADAASRARTAQMTAGAAAAGLAATADAALAQAQAAEGRGRVTRQAAQCEGLVKALVALSGLPEVDLRKKLPVVQVEWSDDAMFSIATPVHAVPAVTLGQRPDVQAAAMAVEAARADVGQALAARYPRLGLSGSVGATRVRSGGVTTDLTTWSIGPLSLEVPLIDGGRRQAAEDRVRVAYDEAVAVYTARVHQAVREVEEALVQLQATASRTHDAAAVRRHLQTALEAVQRRAAAGLASQAELEDARRQALAGQASWLALQHERLNAWVALYRAAGGGW